MIVPCPECNGKVSDTAPTCPHCGFQMIAPAVHELQKGRIACPYCAEMIMAQATICPFCRGAVINGRPVHPAHQNRGVRRPRPPAHVKSFTGSAVIVAVLYLLCWPLSFVLNLIWYNEANTIERETGQEPEGKGCLQALLVIGVVLLIIMGLAFLSNAATRY